MKGLERCRLMFCVIGFAVVSTMIVPAVGSGAESVDGHVASSAVALPLTTSYVASSGTWANIAMGRLSQPVNTFWQQFVLPSGTEKWKLKTPPGVADNGGLVSTSLGSGVVVGFEPSQLLHFSPLSKLSSASSAFQPAVLPVALANVPDALASTTSGAVFALSRGDEILRSSNGLSNWQTVLTNGAVAKSASSAQCDLAGLSAVASSGSPALTTPVIVGASCNKSTRAGIFAVTNNSLRLIGPQLGGSTSGTTKVMNLFTGATNLTGLVSQARGQKTAIVVLRAIDIARPWVISSSLVLARDDQIVATGSLFDGEVFVVVRANGHLKAVVNGRSGSWHQLGLLPANTAVIAGTSGGAIFALSPTGAKLSIAELSANGRKWKVTQTIDVPISYGSSA